METKDELLRRSSKNPLIKPDKDKSWKNIAAFNGCPFEFNGKIGIVYRAMEECNKENYPREFSTIGIAWSDDGINFSNEEKLIFPEHEWEKYGCEDPRVTKIDDTYYIFYTALSNFPFDKDGIKVALAKTKDFKTFEKHLITPFNAKAMTMFPQKIDGKFTLMLTANSDDPPAKIITVQFDKEEDMWNEDIWRKHYFSINDYLIPLQRDRNHHVEVGAPPVYTKEGWLLVYSYIKNYFTENKEFTIEAVLLDHDDPRIVLSRAKNTLLKTKFDYEVNGLIPNIVFPSGVMVKDENLYVYYGGADTVVCMAKAKLSEIVTEILYYSPIKAKKYPDNPLLTENKHNDWESLAVLNPATVSHKGITHLFYRASDQEEKSVIGYAKIKNNYDVIYRSEIPAYTPRMDFEKFGCEDPRAVIIDGKVYMTYTGFDGQNASVCVSSISLEDLENEKWENWSEPVQISEKGVFDKNSCIIPKKINGGYYIFHRINNSICISKISDLNFKSNQLSAYKVFANPRENLWDSLRIGISAPPIETEYGWLLLYHGISKYDNHYRVSAMLLDKKDPTKILSRLKEPILEPEYNSRRKAVVRDVVFPCGAILDEDTIYMYYGEDDKWVSVASISLSKLLYELLFDPESSK